jgi:hypothetical protein
MNSSTSLSKKVVTKMLATGLILIGSFLLLDRSMAFVLKNFASQWGRAREAREGSVIYEDAINVDVLIMGSSRAYRAIDPDALSEQTGYSVRQEASKDKYIRYNYLFYKQYREHSRPPKIMIWGLDYFMFGFRSGKRVLSRLGFSEDAGRPTGHAFPVSNGSSSFLGRVSELSRIKKGFQETFFDFINSFDPGAGRTERRIHTKHHGHIQGIGNPNNYRKFRFPPPPGHEGEHLHAFLDLVRRDGVHVYLVMLPDFYGTFLSHSSEDQYEDEWRRIAQKYDSVQLINFNDVARFDLKNHLLFKDGGYGRISSHLNYHGALKLTRQLAEILKGG